LKGSTPSATPSCIQDLGYGHVDLGRLFACAEKAKDQPAANDNAPPSEFERLPKPASVVRQREVGGREEADVTKIIMSVVPRDPWIELLLVFELVDEGRQVDRKCYDGLRASHDHQADITIAVDVRAIGLQNCLELLTTNREPT